MNKWLIAFLFASCLCQAQNVVLNLQSQNPLQVGEGFSLTFHQNNNEYIATKWSQGKLFYNNGTSKTYDSLNFNRYLNIIEVVTNNKLLTLKPMGLAGALIYDTKNSGSVLISAKVDLETRFLLTNSVGQYLFASYLTTDKGEESRGFRIDELVFVAREEQVVIEEFFVLFRKGAWEHFKLNKSALSKLFKKDKKELQLIASDSDLDLSKKEGLIRLFQMLNKG
ncbi:MAG: hypothetical protein L3J29_09300 [Cyclobacteriaceae bacterium]|nr:hypothetical protein [Cyclobacteriaceae bacterium]